MKLLPFLILAVFLTPFWGNAQELSSKKGTVRQCSSLVKECYAKSGSKRSQCFAATAQHPFCNGSPLGKIIDKRWTLDSSNPDSLSGAPALLGPQFVDHACVLNCDNQLLSVLIEGVESREELKRVNICYDSCLKQKTLEILRP